MTYVTSAHQVGCETRVEPGTGPFLWWILLALIPFAIAVLGYNAAVQTALAYSETVHVAFDLHRAGLLTARGWKCPDGKMPNVPEGAMVRSVAPERTTASHPGTLASSDEKPAGQG